MAACPVCVPACEQSTVCLRHTVLCIVSQTTTVSARELLFIEDKFSLEGIEESSIPSPSLLEKV